jgi:hypothetical protein
MHGKSSSTVICFLAMIAVVATVVPRIRGYDVDTAPAHDQTTKNQASATPLILAQGRCFNGHCY